MCRKKKTQRQIAMGWLRQTPEPAYFPEGYTVKNYDGSYEEKAQYYRIWNGKSGTEKEVLDAFKNCFENYHGCVPEKDVFFVLYGNEYVGTITAIHFKRKNMGYVHFVALREDFRGKGLSRALNYIAMKRIYDDGSKCAYLTTNEWRKNAIRSYINAGFLPLQNGKGRAETKEMIERWRKVYEDLELGELQMLDAKFRPMKKEELNG